MVPLREEAGALSFAGVAWLSSARAVKCLVKSFNERNPYSVLLKMQDCLLRRTRVQAKNSQSTAWENQEEGGDDVKFHDPYELGCTRPTMARTARADGVTRRKSLNLVPVRIEGCNSPS